MTDLEIICVLVQYCGEPKEKIDQWLDWRQAEYQAQMGLITDEEYFRRHLRVDMPNVEIFSLAKGLAKAKELLPIFAQKEFVRQLHAICTRKVEVDWTVQALSLDQVALLFYASSRDQAEALLKTIGLWKSSTSDSWGRS